jgi:peptidoglycan/LPS O-acetylase OafA/YrhL
MQYRPEVDGLRAVAVLPVLFFHAGFTSFSGGFIGVDVFFVISGYLITSLIVEDIKSGSFSLLGFYERRFRRISPALLLVCVATVPFAWVWMTPREFNDYGQSLFATNLSVSNFLFWKEANYFGAEAELKPLLHTWSLAVEEQFYLFFPLLLLAWRRRNGQIWWVAILVLASFALTQMLASRAPAANFYLLPTRFWELGVGALLALAGANRQWLQGMGAQALSLAGLALIVGSIVLLDGARPFPGWWALPPVVGTALVLAFATSGTLAANLLAWRPIVAIGLVSYSVYLWHQPLFAFARIRMFGEATMSIYLLLIALTFMLSYLSWRFVERPFRNRRLVSGRQLFATIGVVGGGLVVFGVIADKTGGLPLRHPNEAFASTIDERLRINFGLNSSCEGKLPLPEVCMTSDKPEVIVWGDSFAMHLVAGIVQSKPDVALVQFTKSVCGPFIDIAPVVPPSYPVGWSADCQVFIDALRRYVESTPSLRYAVLSSPFGQYLGEAPSVLYEGKVVQASPEFILERMKATLDWLVSHGVTPVVFAPPPRDGSDIGACLARSRWLGSGAEKCLLDHAAVKRFGGQVSEFLGDLKRDYRVVDVGDFLCDDITCRVEDGEVLIYRDSGHLAYEGSRFVGETMRFYDVITGTSASVATR